MQAVADTGALTGVPAVLEPVTITGALRAGGVAVTMEKLVLCNISTSRAALPKGTGLGPLVE